MCRCNPNIRTPYCKDCNSILLRRQPKVESLVALILINHELGNSVEETFKHCRSAGYVVTQGEVEIAYMMIDFMEDNE